MYLVNGRPPIIHESALVMPDPALDENPVIERENLLSYPLWRRKSIP